MTLRKRQSEFIVPYQTSSQSHFSCFVSSASLSCPSLLSLQLDELVLGLAEKARAMKHVVNRAVIQSFSCSPNVSLLGPEETTAPVKEGLGLSGLATSGLIMT